MIQSPTGGFGTHKMLVNFNKEKQRGWVENILLGYLLKKKKNALDKLQCVVQTN